MSVFDCIRKLKKEGAITKEQAERAEQLITEQIRVTTGAGADAVDEVIAAQHAFERLRDNAKIKKYQKLKQIETNLARYERLKSGADKKPNRFGKLFGWTQSTNQIIRTFESFTERDIFDGIPQNNVHYRGEALHAIIHTPMANAARKYAPNIVRTIKKFGQKLSDTPSADDIELSKALTGKSENGAAKALVKGWRQSVDMANEFFRKAGGIVPELKGWDLPHVWDSVRVSAKSFDEFYADIRPRLDDDMMKEILQKIRGENPIDDFEVELRSLLKEIRESIITHGLNKERDFGSFKASTKYANRHDVMRYIHFKEGEWANVNAKFGSYDIFTTMNIHLRKLADETAAIEIWGTDIEAGLRHSLDVAEHFIRRDTPINDVEKTIKKLNNRAQVLHGLSVGTMGVGNDALAKSMSGWRNYIVASYLGSTSITALGGDIITNALTAKFNGASITKILKQYIDFIAKSDTAMEDAAELGLLADIYSGSNLAASRMTDTMFDSSTSALLADTTLRATGLAAITEAGRTASTYSIHFSIGRASSKTFGEIDNATRKFLERYGIGSDEWDLIRTEGMVDYHGQKMFNASKLIELDRHGKTTNGYDTAVKLMQGIATERSFGTITTNLRTEAFLKGKSQSGTVTGEAQNGFALFKRWPISMLNTHMARYIGSEQFTGLSGGLQKSAYLGVMVTALTMNGIFAEQMQNIVNGRDVEDWSEELIYRGMLRGGAFGIMADALAKVHNGRRTMDGGDILGFLLGPQASQVLDLGRGIISPLAGDESGGKTAEQIGGNMINFTSRNLPFITSAFYVKLMFRRLIAEQLEIMTNPAARKRMKASVRRQRKKGKTYYFRPGTTSPQRAPNLNK